MSAMGQKQTYAVQKGISALPPKADIYCRGSSIRTSRCRVLLFRLPQHAENFLKLRAYRQV